MYIPCSVDDVYLCSISSMASTSGNVFFKVRWYNGKPVSIKTIINKEQSQAQHVSSWITW